MKERIVRFVAGTLILTGLLLAVLVDLRWLYLDAFVALNLMQSSITRFCPLEMILDKMGVRN